MTDRRFYITLEVTAQCSGGKEKDTPENRRMYRDKLMEFINTRKRKMDYSFYIHSDHVLSINDEKGKEL